MHRITQLSFNSGLPDSRPRAVSPVPPSCLQQRFPHPLKYLCTIQNQSFAQTKLVATNSKENVCFISFFIRVNIPLVVYLLSVNLLVRSTQCEALSSHLQNEGHRLDDPTVPPSSEPILRKSMSFELLESDVNILFLSMLIIIRFKLQYGIF